MENTPLEQSVAPELKKKKMDPVLFLVLVISGGVHAVAALVFGSMVMYKAMKIEEPEFVAPPKKQLPPKKIQYKVQTKTKSKPKPRKITVNNVSKINMPKIDVKMPRLTQKTDFTNITSMGSMGGFGGGGLGMSGKAVTLLKVQAKGERFLFMVDASARTMNPIKGGFDAFDTVRTEIVRLMKTIPSSIVFNMAFVEGYSNSGRVMNRPNFQFFKPSLLAATDKVKVEFEKWIHSINTEEDFQNGKLGLGNSNWKPSVYMSDLRQPGELITAQAAIEQKADVVFFINGGWRDPYDSVERHLTAKEEAKKRKALDDAFKSLKKKGYTKEKLDQFLKERGDYYQKYESAFQAFKKKSRVTGIVNWQWINKIYGGYKGIGLPHPSNVEVSTRSRFDDPNATGGSRNATERYYYKETDVKAFLKAQQKKAYSGLKNKKLSMNVIVFIGKSEKEGAKGKNQGNRDFSQSWTKDMESSVKKFTRDFGGKFRLLVSDTEAIDVYSGSDPKDAEKKLKLEEKIRKAEAKLETEKNTFNIKDLKAKIASYKKLIAEL